tara:strand:+ start:1401 stop:1856 length:456 start_codon:yes stop_codon:yes gene_type:complete
MAKSTKATEQSSAGRMTVNTDALKFLNTISEGTSKQQKLLTDKTLCSLFQSPIHAAQAAVALAIKKELIENEPQKRISLGKTADLITNPNQWDADLFFLVETIYDKAMAPHSNSKDEYVKDVYQLTQNLVHLGVQEMKTLGVIDLRKLSAE